MLDESPDFGKVAVGLVFFAVAALFLVRLFGLMAAATDWLGRN